MSESIVKDYRFNDKNGWEQLICYEAKDGEKVSEWCGCMITDVPMKTLLVTWEQLIGELALKETTLASLKEDYNQKEFEIVFQSDIDFKALYGSASEKTRKQHATKTLSELNQKKTNLELRIQWIKQYTPLIKEVMKYKRQVKVFGE